MQGIDLWDAVLIGGAALIAVSSLTQLMRARRDLLVAQVRRQLAEEQARRRAEERRKKKKEEAA
ncbi:MAG: hypothetical protein AAGB00_11315 [Planctomycetota bacterium]